MTTYNRVLGLYENDLKIPFNEHCRDCDARFKIPLTPWIVGDKYNNDEGRILFAGKPHRLAEKDDIEYGDNKIADGRELGEELFFNSSWAYWSYTRDILNEIYGSIEDSCKHIVFSNVIKCSSSDGVDETSWICANQCISKNKVIFKEIELFKPRKVVFYTFSFFKNLFGEIPFAKEGSVKERTNANHRIKCGSKKLGWWDRTLTANWGEKVDILILGHPQFMKKNEYVLLVSEWLKNT